ncbi:hypothetical protein, partial [Proteus mirabilis]|uniref:hypothetical protein n=1 Tax=Proteus mirabilis TaxID=584 RepID=UPI001FD7D310
LSVSYASSSAALSIFARQSVRQCGVRIEATEHRYHWIQWYVGSISGYVGIVLWTLLSISNGLYSQTYRSVPC